MNKTLRVSNIELREKDLIEYSGRKILQRFDLKEVDRIEEYRGYPVRHSVISLILGILFLSPVIFFPTLLNYESESLIRYSPESSAHLLYFCILLLPVFGIVLLLPFRKKRMNLKVYRGSDWKLVSFKGGEPQEIRALIQRIKSIVSNKTRDRIAGTGGAID